jgi:hypothetical protein
MSEYRSATEPRIGRINGNTFSLREVRYSALAGIAIFEGDIALGSVEQIEALTRSRAARGLQPQGIAIKGDQFRWPGARIPYRIDPMLPRPERVTEAIKHWKENTPIRFLLLETATLNQFPDRVLFTSRDGCSSAIGRRGGEQVVSLGDGCTVGNAIHEIGHTVGLWHEQSRADRNHFVTILRQNIEDGMDYNFLDHVADGDDIGEYDYGSIMHYGPTAFSRNGQPTIVAKNGAEIGQRRGLSGGDIAAVKAMYP